MANMLDYVAWRGDIGLDYSPWNQTDTLILTTLAYLPLTPAAGPQGLALPELAQALYEPLHGEQRLKDDPRELAKLSDAEQFAADHDRLLFLAALTLRYRDVVLHDYVDVINPELHLQFSAVTALLPDGTQVIAYRGTDDTMAGWHEDFNMSFGTVEAQYRARDYLQMIAAQSSGPIIAAGHSKGGNLAVFAAVTVPDDVRARVHSVYSFDGPGLDNDTAQLPSYQTLLPRLHSIIPQRSVVGMLLCYHGGYQVVRSNGRGVMQHNPFTWQLIGTGLEECEEVDNSSVIISDVLHQWLKEMPVENRRLFVTTLFDMLEDDDVTELSQLLDNMSGTAEKLLVRTMQLGKEEKRLIITMLGRFFSLFSEEILDALQKRGQQSARHLMMLQRYFAGRQEPDTAADDANAT